MNEAINLAIEKGEYRKRPSGIDFHVYKMRIVLDPLFWQALGRALGWEEKDKKSEEMWRRTGPFSDMLIGMFEWHKAATKYFDLVLRGRDTEAFFKSLINSRPENVG